MMRLTVMNMDEFLQIVNQCVGAVRVIDSEGNKQNITRQDALQQELRRRHGKNQDYLRLTLEVPNFQDYMKIVFFTIGDC